MTQVTDECSVRLGVGVVISPFALIGVGCVLGDGVFVDVYCRVSDHTTVGANTRIINSARVNEYISIGSNSIIAGTVTERTTIGSNVRFFGAVVHTQNNPQSDWMTTEEPSATLANGCFVGSGSVIIGDITIGENSYVSAGEIVRASVPPDSIVYKGRIFPRNEWKGRLSN